jgi:hypothetical protein
MSDNSSPEKRYFGKYRGTVINNIDPDFRGRIMAEVPDVLGLIPTSWCEACVPLSGPSGPPMGTYFVPPIGAAVWIEFEQGDPNYPIFAGCRFAFAADVPPLSKAGLPISPNIVLQTAGQNSLVISDLPGPTGGIMLKSLTGATLIVNDTGIYIYDDRPGRDG